MLSCLVSMIYSASIAPPKEYEETAKASQQLHGESAV